MRISVMFGLSHPAGQANPKAEAVRTLRALADQLEASPEPLVTTSHNPRTQAPGIHSVVLTDTDNQRIGVLDVFQDEHQPPVKAALAADTPFGKT